MKGMGIVFTAGIIAIYLTTNPEVWRRAVAEEMSEDSRRRIERSIEARRQVEQHNAKEAATETSKREVERRIEARLPARELTRAL
jgi:Na+-transporting methylmalonyl-CoA/oxaloacetate decarboxylase gamma subunit